MRPVTIILFLLPILMLAALACGAQEAEPATVEAPTQIVETQATVTSETATGEAAEETQEPTQAAPMVEPTATATSTEPAEPSDSTPAPEATSTPQPTEAPEETTVPEDTPTAVPITPTPAPTKAEEETSTESGAGPDSFLVGEGSKITFTVEEELARAPVRFDAVISGTGLSGFANLDGSPSEILLDLHSLESDQSFRDRYIRGRMFPNTPTATVVVERLPELPQNFFDGEETSGTLEGSLQIGETVTPLTFDVVARHDGSVINVLVLQRRLARKGS